MEVANVFRYHHIFRHPLSVPYPSHLSVLHVCGSISSSMSFPGICWFMCNANYACKLCSFWARFVYLCLPIGRLSLVGGSRSPLSTALNIYRCRHSQRPSCICLVAHRWVCNVFWVRCNVHSASVRFAVFHSVATRWMSSDSYAQQTTGTQTFLSRVKVTLHYVHHPERRAMVADGLCIGSSRTHTHQCHIKYELLCTKCVIIIIISIFLGLKWEILKSTFTCTESLKCHQCKRKCRAMHKIRVAGVKHFGWIFGVPGNGNLKWNGFFFVFVFVFISAMPKRAIESVAEKLWKFITITSGWRVCGAMARFGYEWKWHSFIAGVTFTNENEKKRRSSGTRSDRNIFGFHFGCNHRTERTHHTLVRPNEKWPRIMFEFIANEQKTKKKNMSRLQ